MKYYITAAILSVLFVLNVPSVNASTTVKHIDGSAITKNRPGDTFWEAAYLSSISLEGDSELGMRCQVRNPLGKKPSVKVNIWISDWNKFTKVRYNVYELGYADKIAFWGALSDSNLLTFGNTVTFRIDEIKTSWERAYDYCINGYNRRVIVWNKAHPDNLLRLEK